MLIISHTTESSDNKIEHTMRIATEYKNVQMEELTVLGSSDDETETVYLFYTGKLNDTKVNKWLNANDYKLDPDHQ